MKLTERQRREAYPWTAYRAGLANIEPSYWELRKCYGLAAGPKTWRAAVLVFRAKIEDAGRTIYGY